MRGCFFFGSAAPVVPDDNHGLAVQFRKAPDDGRIVSAPSVPMKLQEACSHSGDVVARRMTPRMPRQSHLLPSRQPLAFYSLRQALRSRVRGSLFPQMADQIGNYWRQVHAFDDEINQPRMQQ